MIAENVSVICYVPAIFEGRLKKLGCTKNISSNRKDTIYRFYGIKMQQSLIGYVKFSISTFETQGEIDTIAIEPNCLRKGQGSILLETSLCDIIADFPLLEKIIVTSTPSAIPFYIKNGFTPYFGDNNLERKLVRKPERSLK